MLPVTVQVQDVQTVIREGSLSPAQTSCLTLAPFNIGRWNAYICSRVARNRRAVDHGTLVHQR